jgi:2-polyprenyl-6-methoxyphenol hydroxylase-like FAD-dependent oxidoreductase
MRLAADVCIAGGGPAGIMLGLLLAREGVEVVVLEKHDDFFRDFRGDTVHPSTLNLIDALGLRTGFDAVAHTPLPTLDFVIDGVRLHAIDCSTLPPPNRFITLMPQGDLLDLLAAAAARYPSFHLRMGATVTDVIRRDGRVRGVRAITEGGDLEVSAALTIAADGRDSTVRRSLGIEARQYGVPVDVLWFRLPRPDMPLPDTLLWANADAFLVTIPRPGYLQCGLLIAKGTIDRVRAAGLDVFRTRIASAAPRLAGVAARLDSWDDVKLLSVQIDRLQRWWMPGALCLGDAAHAMSPAFGVGINYAIQDAVAAARLIVPALAADDAESALDAACAQVQRRRAWPTALMQTLQRVIHRTIATGRGIRVLHNPPTRRERAVLRLVIPIVRPLAARVIGYGFRPERL